MQISVEGVSSYLYFIQWVLYSIEARVAMHALGSEVSNTDLVWIDYRLSHRVFT